ncbi:MAG: nucleoside triphosphate pyrophosphohydrolase [Candidatus Aminicenantales bacterium]
MREAKTRGQKFEKLVNILSLLRSERGCPWDREQDEKSIAHYFLTEVYEAVEAIYENDAQSLAEELGDVLMEVVFLAQIYSEKDKFSIDDSLESIISKMIRRHPHVFGNEHRETAEEVHDEWIRLKKKEKKDESILAGLPSSAPSLLISHHIGRIVSEYGFDWKSPGEALQKVKEEISELEKVIEGGDADKIASEIGDVFFSLANVSRLLSINPEIVLRKANSKFIKRFNYIEEKLKEEKKSIEEVSLEEMDEIWEESKTVIK